MNNMSKKSYIVLDILIRIFLTLGFSVISAMLISQTGEGAGFHCPQKSIWAINIYILLPFVLGKILFPLNRGRKTFYMLSIPYGLIALLSLLIFYETGYIFGAKILPFAAVALISILSCIFIFKYPNFIFAFLLSVAQIVLIVVTEGDFSVGHFIFLLFILYSLLLFHRFTYRYKHLSQEEQKHNIPPAWLTFLSVLPFIIIILCQSAFSLTEEPLADQIPEKTKNYVINIAEKIAGLFNDGNNSEGDFFSSEFGLGNIGFGDTDKRLGGNAHPTDSILLYVNADKVNAPLYLGGISYDYYNENCWGISDRTKKTITYSIPETDVNYGDFQKYLNLRSLNKTVAILSSYKDSVSVRHSDKFNTDTLFIPINPINGYFHSDSSKAIPSSIKKDSYDHLIAAKDISPKLSYTIFFNRYSAQAIADYSATDFSDPTGLSLAERINYTQIPLELNDVLKPLAQHITRFIPENDIYARAKAIEQYLKTNYKYTYTPGELPQGADFVLYFLLENQKGYCQHFATAMTMLCRSIGIPARYTEGFTVNSSTQQDWDGTYLLTGNSAHAWTEVYIQGLGFIIFEPTASMEDSYQEETPATPSPEPIFPQSPTPGPSPTPSSVPTPTVIPDPTPTPTSTSTIQPYTPTPSEAESPTPTPTPTWSHIQTPTPTAMIPIDEEHPGDNIIVRILKIFLIIVLILISLTALVTGILSMINILRSEAFRNKISSLPPEDALALVFTRLEETIGNFFIPRTRAQTYTEYITYLKKTAPEIMPGIEKIYVKAAEEYTGFSFKSGEATKIDTDSIAQMLEHYDQCLKLIKNHFGKVKYFIYKYLKGYLL